MNVWLTMAHGAPHFRDEALYAVLSAWRQQGAAMDGITVAIATDAPAHFTRVLGMPAWLRFVELNAEQLRGWRGADGYVHRIKPLAIRHAAAVLGLPADGVLVFADSDTAVQSNLCTLFAHIRATGAVALHQREGTLVGNRTHSRSQGRLWRASQRQPFTVAGRSQVLAPDLALWNSGIVGLRGDWLGPVLDYTLALIDELRATLAIATAEQVALSAVLAERGLPAFAAEPWVLHYHQFKEFRADCAAFFARHAGAAPEAVRDAIGAIDPAVRTQPKLAFNALPKAWRQLRKHAGAPWRPIPYPWTTSP